MRESYFDWLKNQVEYFDTPVTHNKLFKKLHETRYVPLMEKDQNRAEDGIHLRDVFFGTDHEDGALIIDTNCSFLEFLVALSIRMNYIYAMLDEDRTADCFWTLINNMGLGDINDNNWSSGDSDYIQSCCDVIINRAYQQDGKGGLFPLDNPRTNQRNVEIWYQMNQYLTEVMKKEGRL